MSRIGKKKIVIPNGVTVEAKDFLVTVKGPKGELKKDLPGVKLAIEGTDLKLSLAEGFEEKRSLYGLSRNLIANMIEGVTKGYVKKLEVIGIGYRFTPAKNKITLTLGYSHPVEYLASKDIEFKADEELKNVIVISGIDKETVGEVAAKIRSLRKPEPYKGKGISYLGEYVPKKAGKAAAGATAGAAS
ncbi:MAG: 50S ribosomal protein L6 [Candidatus Gracilibacteria bacterium]|jgi:large subunit ribosomal protein L6